MFPCKASGAWYLVISQTQYLRNWLQLLLFCSELLLDCIHARLFEIQYLSNLCDFTHRILENLTAINPVLFQVASELQCFHTHHLRSSTLQICVFSHSKCLRIWLQLIPFCSKLLLNCNQSFLCQVSPELQCFLTQIVWDPIPHQIAYLQETWSSEQQLDVDMLICWICLMSCWEIDFTDCLRMHEKKIYPNNHLKDNVNAKICTFRKTIFHSWCNASCITLMCILLNAQMKPLIGTLMGPHWLPRLWNPMNKNLT